MRLIAILFITTVLFGCVGLDTRLELAGLKPNTRSSYKNEFEKTNANIKSKLKSNGQISVKEKSTLYLYPVTLNVKFERGEPNLKYQTWWDTGDFSFGFKGVSNNAYNEAYRKLKEENKGWTIYNSSKQTKAFDLRNSRKVSIPLAMPEGGFQMMGSKKRIRTYTNVFVSHRKAIVSPSNAGPLSAKVRHPLILPYFNLAMRRTGAGMSKTEGEVVINYIATFNGHILVCDKGSCVTVTVPNTNFIMPMLTSKHYSNKKNWKNLDAFFQTEIGNMIGRTVTAATGVAVKQK